MVSNKKHELSKEKIGKLSFWAWFIIGVGAVFNIWVGFGLWVLFSIDAREELMNYVINENIGRIEKLEKASKRKKKGDK